MKSLLILLAVTFSVKTFANSTMYNTSNCFFSSKQNIGPVPKTLETPKENSNVKDNKSEVVVF